MISAKFPDTGIGFLGVAFAFGLTVLTMAYAIGHISGCHLNPAVSIGLWASKRFPSRDLIPYIIAQTIGSIVAAIILFLIVKDSPGFSLSNGFAANGYGIHSPGGYSLMAAMITEFLMTFFFLFVILGAGHKIEWGKFSPIAVGLCLTLIHLISIPITNTSVNPARSTGPALIVGGWALSHLWLFWIIPIVGALVAGYIYYRIFGQAEEI